VRREEMLTGRAMAVINDFYAEIEVMVNESFLYKVSKFGICFYGFGMILPTSYSGRIMFFTPRLLDSCKMGIARKKSILYDLKSGTFW